MLRTFAWLCLLLAAPIVSAAKDAALHGRVFDDANGNGVLDAGEHGIAQVAVSNGSDIARTDAQGRYRLPARKGQIVFIVKPAGWRVAPATDGLPGFWHSSTDAASWTRNCIDFAMQKDSVQDADLKDADLDVLVFGDPQPRSMTDVGYYDRDIVAPLVGRQHARLGVSLGDIVNDNLPLYPAINAVTAKLGVPWLHVAGNHDLDFDAADDASSLSTFHRHFGPDTVTWEEARAVFVALDDVIYLPGAKLAYIGGFRETQFRFLERYLPSVPKDRLLVLMVHIPLFEAARGKDTFRDADRARLFELLRGFPHVLLLSAHSHAQRHWFHDATTGWHGAAPLHEYNVGAACGAYWSGVKDAEGIPDSTMSDGTPNGYASLRVARNGVYALAWHPARDPTDSGIGLHAPAVLRRGAYPAWGVYANVYMGYDGTRVEYRIDGGPWKPMTKVSAPDPRLLVENMRDDLAVALRGYDRSPEAEPSPHLWRGALATDLASGEHSVEVRAFDEWRGELRATTRYRLDEAQN